MNPTATTLVDDGRPTIAELHGNNPLAQAARQYWLRKKPATFNPQKLKSDIYDVLEEERFGLKGLLVLENLQFLEKWLWPNFSEDADDFHVILVALMVSVKRREGLPIWDHLATSPANFSNLFRRILQMCLIPTINLSTRLHLLCFIVTAFQSLDSGLVRKECASLVSIAIWQNLSSEDVRNAQMDKYPQTRKAWRAAGKRYEAADDETELRLRFERSWLYEMTLSFLNMMYQPPKEEDDPHEILVYCERFVELLTDLVSQLPTRRYVNFLLKDLHILPAIKLSPLYRNAENGLFRDLYKLLAHFMDFSIDDVTGLQLSQEDIREAHSKTLAKLQRVAFKHFKEKLTILALANYGNLGQRDELSSHLADLADEELVRLVIMLGLRTEYPKTIEVSMDRTFLMEVLLSMHERRRTFQEQAKALPILPNEITLFEDALVRAGHYDGSRPLAIPKLNLQYLTVGDFLWRSFILYRHEAFYGIRQNIEEDLKRLQPKIIYPEMRTQFHGFSKMALLINKPSILEVAPARVGEEKPAYVRAEVLLDMTRLADDVRREWQNLRPEDVVFLLRVRGVDDSDKMITNGGADKLNVAEKYGIKCLRAAKVVTVLDQNDRALHQADNPSRKPLVQCRLHLKLDPDMYEHDAANVKAGKPDVYDTLNVIIRRRSRENNFQPVLESIQDLTQTDVPMPSWLQEVFLGYGNPSGAHYSNLRDQPEALDFRDTFLDWRHLVESFPGKKLLTKEGTPEGCDPPYVIKKVSAPPPKPKPGKKRRREQVEPPAEDSSILEVSTYKLPNMGPYPVDQPRKNLIRFTPAQVEGIQSGTNPGLTVILGPPGTGKTDVATQVISNLYHNFPNQRTLLVAHSNQALNQLFEKITALDIDARHLLRLGHGEEDLSSVTSWSKQGRVESFMDNRMRLLAEVDRLAECLCAPGAHGDSCETADYFNQVYVLPAWERFQAAISINDLTVEKIRSSYPFNEYFSNAPTPMFPDTLSVNEAVEAAQGGYRHIAKIFFELSDIWPFELLRSARDRQNYLLTKEARIVAMTSTHAAIKRHDIAKLGFRYDNVVMEEAAQITEIETFIPLALQADPSALKRVVLCGDHFQNSPILQNISIKQYANLDQSLFARLVRLGVPLVQLDAQGRARPHIASLYSWRYRNLGNLPLLEQREEYRTANAGFLHEVQFVDVPDYRGAGESHPQPHYVQNLGEAEYVVAIFMYMRLLGYPKEKITILTTYAGQRALIRDVLNRRCARSKLFGMPHMLTTVDKYQGEQNDYVLLSLVRTSRVGYLRDIRRLTVALSRARLGLYVLGRREVFSSCYELAEPFSRLCEGRSDKLTVVTGEMWPASRCVGDPVDSTEMASVEHIGQYVYEMTQTKVASMRAQKAGIIGARMSMGPEARVPVPTNGTAEGVGVLREEMVGKGDAPLEETEVEAEPEAMEVDL